MEPLGGGYLYDACPTEVVAHFQCKKTKVVIGRTYCRKSVPCSYPTARSTMICTRVGKAHADYVHRTVNLFDGHIVTETARAA
jgi:hypothetical protein